MPTDPYHYRAFPPEVASNTHDFEVRLVVHNGHTMRGVFPIRSISALECSLYIGTYPGHRRSREENALKVSRYAVRHSVDEKTALQKIAAYSLSLKKIDPGYLLDPTDDEGNLRQEFIPYIVCYLNEPPPGHPAKSVFVYNRPRCRYEVWLLQSVEQDEEIFLYYGKNYLRDYPFNACNDSHQFSHYIPTESIFIPDQRGIPALLAMPDLVSGCKTIQRNVEKGEMIEIHNNINSELDFIHS